MKYLIGAIFFFQISFALSQTDKSLYLFFEKEKGKMYIYQEGLNSENNFKIYVYNIKDKGSFKEMYFDSETSDEKSIYHKKKGRYKTKLHQIDISLTELKELNVKDYKWLEKKVNSFTNFQALYQFYDKIFIVQKDILLNKAIITEVDNIEIVE